MLLVSDARLRNPAISAPKLWFDYDFNLAYVRKSWKVASRLYPDVVVFLGDTFASGRSITSEEEYVFRPIPEWNVSIGYWKMTLTPTTSRYDQYHRAFEATFPRDASVPLYLIPGNNDIGCVSVVLEKSRSKPVFTGSAIPRLFPRMPAGSLRNISDP